MKQNSARRRLKRPEEPKLVELFPKALVYLLVACKTPCVSVGIRKGRRVGKVSVFRN